MARFFQLEKLILFLFIFTLSWQTRVFLFGGGSFFNEWTSGYLYASDILLLLLLGLWLLRVAGQRQKKICVSWRLEIILGIFWLLGGFSLFWAVDRILSLYAWAKLTELLLLFFYARHNRRLFGRPPIFFAFILGAVFQGVLAIAQFFRQQSWGLKWLGESPLAPGISGVAKIDFFGQKIMRAYGTLPHPNLLGVLMLLALVLFLAYILKNGWRFWQTAPLGVLFFGLGLSFSRLAILAFLISFLVLFIYGLKQKIYRRRIWGLLFLFIIFGLLLWGAVGQVLSQRFDWGQLKNSQAVDLRAYYLQIGWAMFWQRPWGVGVGAFANQFMLNFKSLGIVLESWVYQPIHNIYLLVAVELGFVGLVVLFWFFSEILRVVFRYKDGLFKLIALIIFGGFLFLGFFDHYFWTLQQGQLLFWGMLGLLVVNCSSQF